MSVDNKLNNIIDKKDIFGKVFLFYGEDKYYKDMYIGKIKRIFKELVKGINYIVLDDTNVLNVIYEANTPAFGYENKLIIITNSNLFKIKRKKKNTDEDSDETGNDNELDLLEFLSKEIPNNVTIIFNEQEVAKTKKIYKVISNLGSIFEFNKLSENEIVSYSINLCKKYGIKLSNNNATYFYNVCSENMQDIINELRKLIEYTGTGNEITKQNIDIITTKKISAIIFDLTDYLGKRDIKKSIEILDNLIYQKEPIQVIYIMIYKHFKNLYLIKLLQKQGINNINDILQVHPFVYKKCVNQLNNYTLNEIINIYKQFMNIDIENKSGNIDLYTGIINVMCNIK